MFIKTFNDKKITKNICTKRRITENKLLFPPNNNLLTSIFRNTRKRHRNFLKNNITKAVFWRSSIKKVLLEISQNSQENNCVKVSFLIKLQASTCVFIKKQTLAQFFSCEFCNISNVLSYRTPLMAASYSKGSKTISLTSFQSFQS